MTLDRLTKPINSPTTTRHWRTLRHGPFAWRIDPSLAADEPWLRDPMPFLKDHAQLLKAPVPGFDARVVRIPRDHENFVLKEYRPAKLKDRVKSLLRRPRALRVADSALLLQGLEIPAVKPVAAGVSKRVPSQSFLVTRELAHARTLLDYANQSAACRRFVTRSLGWLMGRLHHCNLLHGDAHQANFVVDTRGNPVVTLIDVDSLKRVPRVTLPRAVSDVRRLLDYTEPSVREMMLFAVAYCRARGNVISPREFTAGMAQPYRARARLTPSLAP